MPGRKLREMAPRERLRRAAPGRRWEEAAETVARGGMSIRDADALVENAVGVYGMPLGVATNFRINGRAYVAIPMATEEPSVIAAASAGAKLAVDVRAHADGPRVAGQIQIMNPRGDAMEALGTRKEEIVGMVRESLPSTHMDVVGGASGGVSCTMLAEDMLKVEFFVDTGDAMGANAVNTACERVAPLIEDVTGGTALLRILSNHMQRMARAESYFDVPGDVAAGIVNAYRFASLDVPRAVTHNKGIMNGVIAVATATGQDTRAMEAGAHAHASSMEGGYGPLSKWEIRDNRLYGSLSMPLAVGTVGGLTGRHPVASICLNDMLGGPDARELAGVMAAVGLCQNFAALRALVTDGIQKGHMRLHSRRLPAAPHASP